MSNDLKLIFEGTGYLFARIVLVCVLAFMSIPLASVAPSILNPILAIFYFIMLLYFFVLTTWHEGVRDRNRVETGLIKENKAKGFICSGIVCFFLAIFFTVPIILLSNGISNIFSLVVMLILAIFAQPTLYTTSLFLTDVTIGSMGGNLNHLVSAVTVAAIIYLICAVASGIGYIVGYKNIVFIGDKIEKIKKMFK